jgi:hypothetical protein
MCLLCMRGGPLWSAILFLFLVTPVFAQATIRPVRRIEASIAGGWLGGADLGTRDANLRQNATPPVPRRLFSTDTRLAGQPMLDVGGGFAFNRRWTVEGALVFARPELRTSVSADAEGAPSSTVAERIDQYIVEGRLVILFEEARLGTRTVPFATAGAGYLRQLHEGRTVIEEGHVYHVGGGLKHWLLARDRGRVKAAGLRADLRLYLLAAGFAFDDRPTRHAAASGGFFVVF